jgi:hypothetical protein
MHLVWFSEQTAIIFHNSIKWLLCEMNVQLICCKNWNIIFFFNDTSTTEIYTTVHSISILVCAARINFQARKGA